MNQKQIIYTVNGVAVSWWHRMATSKTFWVIAAFVLTAADRWNRGQITSADFFQMVQIGVIGILIRAALQRSELAANAADASVAGIGAVEKNRTVPPEILGPAMCLAIAGALLTLSACAPATGSLTCAQTSALL